MHVLPAPALDLCEPVDYIEVPASRPPRHKYL
jgi:hypothetical protein